MNLNELMRAKTREIEAAITSVEEKTLRLRTEREAAESRMLRAREETGKRDAAVAERRVSLEESDRRVRELENEIKNLRTRLEQRLAEREGLQGAVRAAEEDANQFRRERQREESEGVRLGQEIEGLATEQSRHRSRFADARRAALQEYNLGVWQKLGAAAASQESRRRMAESAQALKTARHEDPQVASLYEARLQWRRILADKPVELVRAAAESGMADIEREIEKRFPNALVGEDLGKEEGELEELFWFADEGEAAILLPIPIAVLDAVRSGATGRDEQLAMRVLWGLCRSSVVPEGNGELATVREMSVLRTHGRAADPDEPVAVALTENAPVSFIFARLPSEMQEALR